MSLASLDGDCHAVAFDVNVFLNASDLVGAPFTWDKFRTIAGRTRNDALPHPHDRRVDSLRALAVSQSGQFAGTHTLEVWTSDHIDDLVYRKLTQPREAVRDEDRGLGWDPEDAVEVQRRLIDDLVYDMTNGASMGQIQVSEGSPPLDYEDGCVLATAMSMAPHEEAFYHRYLVTADRQFRNRARSLSSVHVLMPHEWVQLLQASRSAFARLAMKPPHK